mmetsp:Transcript_35474/g.89153  ORF Transcript_35474/g.89153 Transcript_35474/m.89153 type:complete len:422 (-) Transcript_35474:320-1585(-)|eukprot:CAMPEP_0177631450 /NCGR_PEP_ID=MMETSP0447-20121125/1756_1 /TAXON_ID=0 /ORGANISM="Stygamoeba regulata, Strain BSH-02190019" /LENGTH=421 /DNA_ID=CAMNT_0019132935 /DNA_START=83 /DNA_END=1348 /DNA_ORIENTATION=-
MDPLFEKFCSPRAVEMYGRLRQFMRDKVQPAEEELNHAFQFRKENRWSPLPQIEALKAEAKGQGLWNMFLPAESDPERKYGAGLTNLEYAFFAEEMGRIPWSSEVFNCSAPDTGNMEVLVRYGTEAQKRTWLQPLLEGKIRSCYAMTEPRVASSDATNMESTIIRDGDHYVVNGLKWWTSGAMDERCSLCVFMGRTPSDKRAKHQQHSMILIPMDAPGIHIKRPLTVFGYDDAPHGHAEVEFVNVRVPASNLLLGEGRGFEISQGRLGPGRIHHCMRLIGMAERALDFMKLRAHTRVTFGKRLVQHGTVAADIAESRCDLDQCRLLCLKAAHVMDMRGNKAARKEVAMIKVVAPNTALRVIDRAIQVHGGGGVCSDFPIAYLWVIARTLRLADGPDEVHRMVICRLEMAALGKLLETGAKL